MTASPVPCCEEWKLFCPTSTGTGTRPLATRWPHTHTTHYPLLSTQPYAGLGPHYLPAVGASRCQSGASITLLPRSVDPLTTLPPSHVSEPSASILRVRAAAARSSPEVWKRKGAPIWLIYGAAQVRNGLASLNAAIFLPTATGQQRARSRFARVKAHGKHLHRRARLTPSAFYPDLECGRDSAPRLPGQSRGLTSCSRHPGLHGIHMQHVDRSSWVLLVWGRQRRRALCQHSTRSAMRIRKHCIDKKSLLTLHMYVCL
ncbi:hypothetical protein B0T24DRAFT_105690 [Lasiosphaeria ovina]|uniref:Uncharacterized protein n=1 Tax=Lasiosphaeria ovina TaxID=92902 RepID=A0AAE0MZH6_9PEZI|nr:hypothetical protein B0T24DRAFT_105690 [Lasiosphaeria ovina]